MIATVIFVLAALAAMDLARGSVKAVKDAQEVTVATWLLQKVIVDLETKIETEGIEKACEKKKEGKFEEPYQTYSYVTYCSEVDFRISEAASAVLGGSEENEKKLENSTLKTLLDKASTYINQSTRELHAEVNWLQGKTPRVIDVTTHVVNYQVPFTFP